MNIMRQSSPVPTSKTIICSVLLLDDTTDNFEIATKSNGETLFKVVVDKLGLLEEDYFDLQYTNIQGLSCWLDHEKPIIRQLPQTNLNLRFIVKFYTPDPGLLQDEFTRYLFALQVKRDLFTGLMTCQEHTTYLLASYIAQAEYGDAPDDQSGEYLLNLKLLPNINKSALKKIACLHRLHLGQSSSEADFNLLDVARKTDFYGMVIHNAKDHEAMQLGLCVTHMGIIVWLDQTRINIFSWAKIRKLSFKRKRFLIKLHNEGIGFYKELIEFYFPSRNDCKNFWKCCLEHHAFFRCQYVKKIPRNKTRVVSHGSSFRYCGRTQKQLTEYIRNNPKKKPHFLRSMSVRTMGSSRTTPHRATTHSLPRHHRPMEKASDYASLEKISATKQNSEIYYLPNELLMTSMHSQESFSLPQYSNADISPPSKMLRVKFETTAGQDNTFISFVNQPIDVKFSDLMGQFLMINRTYYRDLSSLICNLPNQNYSIDNEKNSYLEEFLRLIEIYFLPIFNWHKIFLHKLESYFISSESKQIFISDENIFEHYEQYMKILKRLLKLIPRFYTGENYSEILESETLPHIKNQLDSVSNLNHEDHDYLKYNFFNKTNFDYQLIDKLCINSNFNSNKYSTLGTHYRYNSELTNSLNNYKKDYDFHTINVSHESSKINIATQFSRQLNSQYCRNLYDKNPQNKNINALRIDEDQERLNTAKYNDIKYLNTKLSEEKVNDINTLNKSFLKEEHLRHFFDGGRLCHMEIFDVVMKPAEMLAFTANFIRGMLRLKVNNNVGCYEDCIAFLHCMAKLFIKYEDLIYEAENIRICAMIEDNVESICEYTQNHRVLRFGSLRNFTETFCRQILLILMDNRLIFCERNNDKNIKYLFRVTKVVELHYVKQINGSSNLHDAKIFSFTLELSKNNLSLLHHSDTTLLSNQKDIDEKINLMALSSDEKSRWIEDISLATAASTHKVYSTLQDIHQYDTPADLNPQYKINMKMNINSNLNMRINNLLNICWHRNLGLSIYDRRIALQNCMCGYVEKSLDDKITWIKHWVTLQNMKLCFFRNHEDTFLISSLAILGFNISTSVSEKEYIFKMKFRERIIYFKVENQFTLNKWYEALSSIIG